MPPRKAPARRNKLSTKKAPTPVANNELPDVKTETQLTDDAKVNETQPVMSSIPEQVSNQNETEGVVLVSDSVIKEEEAVANRPVEEVNEAMNDDVVVKEDLEDENEDVDEDDEDPEEDLEENAGTLSLFYDLLVQCILKFNCVKL